MKKLANTYLDQFAVTRYWKRGKCPNSCFRDGGHRVGLIPVLSALDGGLPGDSAQEICLECGKMFSKRVFYPKRQPRRLTTHAADRASHAEGSGAEQAEFPLGNAPGDEPHGG